MKKHYSFALLICFLLPWALPAHAQIIISSFSPNTQDFNTLTTSTTASTFSNNITLTGLYLGANVYLQNSPTFPSPSGYYDYSPDKLGANDGSVTTAQFYSLGSAGSTDRAIGGLATGQSGVGYAGLRYKNSTGAVIKNLAVTYTMEQWYNSGTIDQANFQVHYRTSAAGAVVNSVYESSGTWQPVTQLNVFAPSTTKPITNQNGNVASNRVTVSYTIMNVNLAANAEIMLRWKYSLDNTTNGNGLGIEDVTVTPESNIFYSKTTGNLNALSTWGANTDGTGTGPANFTTANQVFYVRGVAPSTDRLSAATWTVSGTNSKIVVGQDGAQAKLFVAYNADINGTIDVATGSLLRIEKINSANLKLGNLNVGSTVEYISTNNAHTILPKQYSRLRLINAGGKNLGGNVTVTDTLSFRGDADLTLGTYNLTLSSLGAIAGASSTSFVVTNSTGKLRVPVAGLNSQNVSTAVLFPVGTAAGSYTPVSIRQNTAQSQDIFEVRVIDNAYRNYDAAENPVGAVMTGELVKKTWFISKETPALTNINVEVALEWNTSDVTADFVSSRAFLDHYTGGKWEKVATTTGATEPRTGAWRVVRSGITSFSPFGVSSSANGVLPVQLAAFGAARHDNYVVASWKTATELNNDHFEVERSADGFTFKTLGSVAGQGTATTSHAYTFTDKAPLAVMGYYRLRQVDTDGTTTYSQVVAVAGIDAGELVLVPNPGTGIFQIVGSTNEAMPVRGVVRNVLGAEVQTIAADGTLDLREQPAGIYLVQLQTDRGIRTLRAVKQ